MKQLAPLFITLAIIAIIVTMFLSVDNKDKITLKMSGNTKLLPIDIIPHKMQDPHCMMAIESQNHSAQATSPSGNTWFFDDIGCLILWIEDKNFKDEAKLYAFSIDSKKWIDAKEACYIIGTKTPMLYGFGTYESKSEKCIDFKTLRLKMLQGETMANPKIRKKILGY